ncbi:MAG: GNAT family N-acetyltransferase [Agarilytica sp.]
MTDKKITICAVDFSDSKQRTDLCQQLIAYSSDPMGGGRALAEDTAQRSIALLAEKTYAFSFLAYDGDTPVGFSNCFENVSTFASRCNVNIHDLAVLPEYRGRGIGKQLLQAIEDAAKARDYCKITLEVLEGNHIAQNAYNNFGFEGYQLSDETGRALFWQKTI